MRFKKALGTALVALLCFVGISAHEGGENLAGGIPDSWKELNLTEGQAREMQRIREDYARKFRSLDEQVVILKKQRHDELALVLREEQRNKFERIIQQQPTVTAAYSVIIEKIEETKDHRKEKKLDAMDGVVVFNRKIPQGAATMIVDLKDRKVTLDLIQEEGKKFPQGEPTNRFTVSCMPKKQGFVLEALIGRSARVYSRYFPPELGPVDPK